MEKDLLIGGLAIVGIMVTGFFGYAAGKNVDKAEYITKQREDWRNYIRKWIEEMTVLVLRYDETKDPIKKKVFSFRIKAMTNSIIVRLNPNRDELFINYIKECQTKLSVTVSNQSDYNMQAITFYLSKLLKNDWEKVKRSNSYFGNTPIMNLCASIILLLGFLLEYKTFVEIGNANIFAQSDFFKEIILIIVIFVFFKIIYSILSNFENIRAYDTENIFKLKRTAFLKTNNVDKALSGIFTIMVLCTILISRGKFEIDNITFDNVLFSSILAMSVLINVLFFINHFIVNTLLKQEDLLNVVDYKYGKYNKKQ